MLMRFDPFRELEQVTQQVLRQSARPATPMDAYRRGDRFFVQLDLPGVDPDSIDLTVEQNVLSISAVRQRSFAEDDEVLITERPQGEFRRQLFLGEQLDTDNISADYAHGVLTLTLSVAEQAKPRKVAVNQSGSPKQISGTAA